MPRSMRRVSLVALTFAGTGAMHGAVAQDVVVSESTLTATLSQSLEADTNYDMVEDSPGTTYFGDTRLGIDLLRGTETQNLAFTLDTGLRALQQPEEDFEWVLASPSSARLSFDQQSANTNFDVALGARSSRVDSSSDELVFDEDLPALPPSVVSVQNNAYQQRYDFNGGFVTGNTGPSSIGVRVLASTITYSDDGGDSSDDDLIERTGADGTAFWSVRLNPTLSGVLTGTYSYQDADDSEQTQIQNSVVDLGLVYEPGENTEVGFGVGYAIRDERTTDVLGNEESQKDQGVSLRALAGYQTDDITFGLNASYTTAAPEPRFSGDARVSYALPRSTLTARLFQDFGLGSDGEDQRVTGAGVSYAYTLNSVSDLFFDVNAAQTTGADDISDTAGSDSDNTDLNFSAQLNHAFTDVVSASFGYRYSQSSDETVDDARSNRVFVQIGRSFVTGF